MQTERKFLRQSGKLTVRFFAQGYGDRKAMFRNIEVVAIRIRTAGLGIGSSVGAGFRQFFGIDLFHPLDDLLAVLYLKAEMGEAGGGVLLMGGENGEVEVTVGEKDGAAFILAFVQHLHLKDIHPPCEWP